MTEKQNQQVDEAFKKAYGNFKWGRSRRFSMFLEGFKAGLAAQQPQSLCLKGCGNYNDGMCDRTEKEPGHVVECNMFYPVAYDAKEAGR